MNDLSRRASLIALVSLFASLFVPLGAGCPDEPRQVLTRGITPDQHTDFPIASGTVHALELAAADGPISCASCHAGTGSFAEFTCVGCHEHRQVGLDDDGGRGMDEVHTSMPGYFYESPSCLGCHPAGLAAEISRQQHDEFFPIDIGTAHAENSCAECHVQPGDRKVVTCTECHSDTNADGLFDHDVAAMLTAHGPDMDRLGYAWDTASCQRCHPRAEVPGIVDHEAEFPIASGTVHAGRSCVDCHSTRQDHRELSCTSCHEQVDDGGGARDVHGEARMEQAHVTDAAVTGYAFEARACYACHQQAQVPGVMDHETFFPIGPTSFHPLGTSIDTPAVLVECATCHQDSANTRNVTCVECHAHEQPLMDTFHAGFPDYAFDSTQCVFCHLGGVRLLDHAAATDFPVSTPADSHWLDDPFTTTVDGLLCSECHTNANNRNEMGCTTCHEHSVANEDLNHGTAMADWGYRYDSGACYGCHDVSQVPGVFDHEPIYPLLPPSGGEAHRALQCIDCHANKADRAGSLTCTDCHQPTSAQDAREVHSEPRMAEVHTGFTEYQWSPQSCVGCHTDGTAESATQSINHVWFPIGEGLTHAVASAGGQIACNDCHTTVGAPQQFECITCHLEVNDGAGARAVHGTDRMNERHSGVSGFSFTSQDCYGCHPNGEPAGNFDHVDFPIVAGSAHAAVSCADCHTGNAPKDDVNALGCAQCHAVENTAPETIAAIHNGVPDFVNASPSCWTCHPNAEPVGPMEHSAYFPIAAGSMHASAAYAAKVTASQNSCTACHASRVDRANTLCSSCHASVAPIPTTAHTGVRGFTNTSPACKACHADAQVMRLTAHPKDGNKSWHTHENATCQNCHINQATCLLDANCYNNGAGGQPNPAAQPAYRVDKPWGYDFNRYGCLGCHKHKKPTEDNRHDEENEYISYGNPTCINCHGP